MISCQPQKCSHISHYSGNWKISDNFNLFWIGQCTITTYYMPKECQVKFCKSTFARLSFKLTSLNFNNTYRKCSKCFSQLRLWMFKSLMKTFKNFSKYTSKIYVIIFEKVLVAFFLPKGMMIKSSNLNLVIKVDLWTFF